MGKPNGKAALFAIRLRRSMTDRGLSVRALGKLSDPRDPERGRRRVQRHLSGKFLPSVASRIGYAQALSMAQDAFLDDDDEEADPVSDLMRAARRVAREAVRA